MHRSDGSGTTFNFTNYLVEGQPGLEDRRSAPTPRSSGRSASAPRATKASPTTSANTKGSIGYVEYAYAKQNKLTYTKMINKDGKTVAPTVGSLPGRGRQRRLEVAAGLRRHPRPTSRATTSWPITARDLHPDPQAAAGCRPRRAEALKFFAWAYEKGDKMAEELDYVPMPDNVVKDIQKIWANEIKDASGKPIFACRTDRAATGKAPHGAFSTVRAVGREHGLCRGCRPLELAPETRPDREPCDGAAGETIRG